MHSVEANGAAIPAIGMGTWTLKGDQATRLVAKAIEVGYRHVDTAAMYDNETDVGAGLRDAGLPRDDVFVTTKIWPTDCAAGDLQASLAASLDRLKLDQVDLALIHWPPKAFPLAEAVEALNDAKAKGMARHIGVSNFTIAQVEEATRRSEAPLVCNQFENHPYLNPVRVVKATRDAGMAVVSYCPLGRGGELFAEPAVAAAAARLGKSPAQIVLRWQVQQDGVVAIPRTSNPDRLAENLAVFDFALTDGEMTAISALAARAMRICDFEFSPVWDAA